jgi:hypothetical protein
MSTEFKTFRVVAKPKFPAWDEKNGWSLEIRARSRSEAIQRARREIRDAGHGGVIYFSAKPLDDLTDADLEVGS